MDSSSSPHQQDGKTISKNLIQRRARSVTRQKRAKESKICPECKGDRVEVLLRCQSCFYQYSSQDSEHDTKRPCSDCMKRQDPRIPNHTEKSSELDENRQFGKFDGTGTTFHHTFFMEESLVERRIHIDSSDAGSAHLRSFDGMNSNHERKDDARSQGSPNDHQITRGMTGDLLETRDLLASLDLFVSPHASLNIDLNKPLDCGVEEFYLPEPSQVFDLSIDSTCINKENVSTLQLCRTENSSPVRAVADKGKAPEDTPPVLMSTSSSYQNNNLQVFPESGSHNMPPIANDPKLLQSSQFRGVSAQQDTAWSEVELDSLWVGARRHGQRNWDFVLGNQTLHFLPGKTPEVLAKRWEEEQVQFLYGISASQLRSTSPHIASRDMNNHQSIDARDLTGNRPISLGSTWSGVELDSLWVGARRHGRGNWDVVLGDQNLHFLPGKTPEVLAKRWEEEQVQFLYGISASQLRSTSPHIASRDMNNHQSIDARYLTGNRPISLGSTRPLHEFNAQNNNQLQIPDTNSTRFSPNSSGINRSRRTENSAIWSMCSPDGELLWEHFPWFV